MAEGRYFEVLFSGLQPGLQASNNSLIDIAYGLLNCISLREASWKICALRNKPSVLVLLDGNIKSHQIPALIYHFLLIKAFFFSWKPTLPQDLPLCSSYQAAAGEWSRSGGAIRYLKPEAVLYIRRNFKLLQLLVRTARIKTKSEGWE